MRIGLFVPCYVDHFYPRVGQATLEVLERLALPTEFPLAQTCCGQPMSNTGCTEDARPLAEQFLATFRPYTHVVAPSGSCVAMVRVHYEEFFHDRADYQELRAKTFELCEFLHDVLGLRAWEGSFPYKVGVHQSCHGLRELRLGTASELAAPAHNKMRVLLESLAGIELVELTRADECCGFGGTFAVSEEAVSCMMGRDRLHDHQQAGSQVVTAGDMSCLMHLEGLARRDRLPLHIMHVAEILAGYAPGKTAA